MDEWELLIIDNGSDVPIAELVDISWHPNGKVIREDTLGLTHARLAGISGSIGNVIVFVDDDNVLFPDYLEHALEIANKYACIGAWGGQCHAEFETPPPAWFSPYMPFSAIHTFEGDRWSNLGFKGGTIPVGAGLCVRRNVAQRYARACLDEGWRQDLDRKGTGLLGGGDIDLSLTAVDLGLGTGFFHKLRLQHLIHAGRLTKEYILRLLEDTSYSDALLRFYRGGELPCKTGRFERMHRLLWLAQQTPERRRAEAAIMRGRKRAALQIAQPATKAGLAKAKR